MNSDSGQTKHSAEEDTWVGKKWGTFFKVWGVILLVTAIGGCGIGITAGEGIGFAFEVSAVLVGGAIGILIVSAFFFAIALSSHIDTQRKEKMQENIQRIADSADKSGE